MSPILFWIFSILMLGFGALVVLLKNPVSSAMSLVVSFICLAALFVSLDAYFIGIIQVLVYTGAVMVLFLFIIMLLDLKDEKARNLNHLAFSGGVLIVAGFLFILGSVVRSFEAGKATMPELSIERLDDVRLVGLELFTHYNLPFQVIGVLLLAATVGVIILSKKELR